MDDHPDQARRKPTTPAVLGVIVFQSGLAYEREGNAAEARAAYQRVLRDYPGTQSADAARKMLAKQS
jgi:TolA-binding protein